MKKIKGAKPSGAWEVHDWDETCETSGMCSKMYSAEEYESLLKKANELIAEVERLKGKR